MSDRDLPPLPEPRMWYDHSTQRCRGMAPFVCGTNEELWDAHDMRAYALAAIDSALKDQMLNGLTEDETAATASVSGLTLKAEQAEPVAWIPISEPYSSGDVIDVLMEDGSILCGLLPQFDGDLWWAGAGTGEKFIDPKLSGVTHWRLHGIE